MLKILIVDDEAVSLKYISSLIDWEKTGYELCAASSSAKEAMEVLEHRHIDIVLLDVFMPGETGIDLSRKIARFYPSVAMVAISSYDDYDYVREILKNGAHDYILKHRLNSEVLAGVLSTVAENLGHTAVKKTSIMLRQEVERWLCGDQACPFPSGGKWLTVTTAYVEWPQEITGDMKITVSEGILRILESCTGEKQTATAVYLPSDRFVICTLFSNTVSMAKIKNELFINTAKSKNSIKLVYNLDLMAQECPLTSTREKLPFLEAKTAEQLKSLHNNGKSKKESGISLTLSQKKQIVLVLEERNPESAEILIKDIYSRIKEGDTASYLLVTKELIEILKAAMQEYQINLDFLPSGNALFEWIQTKTIEELVLRISGMYRQVIKEASSKHQKFSEHVLRANEYINNHYTSNIGLKEVADNIGISPAYLSRIYSQEAGMTLTDYLNKIRINAAKGYLLSGIQLKKVALNCGFSSYNYFFKVFKDVEGVTPHDFLNSNNIK